MIAARALIDKRICALWRSYAPHPALLVFSTQFRFLFVHFQGLSHRYVHYRYFSP